jgi:hypothetical protein
MYRGPVLLDLCWGLIVGEQYAFAVVGAVLPVVDWQSRLPFGVSFDKPLVLALC